MRFIAMEYLEHSPVLAFPVAALAIFMTVFVIVFVRAALAKKTDYEAIACLPLEEGAAARKEPS